MKTTKTDAPRYTNISQIKQANKAAGNFWFSPDTIKMFASKVESRIYDAAGDYRMWIESQRNYDDSAREYKLAVFNAADGDISYVSSSLHARTLVFTTKSAALECLHGLL